MKKLFMFIAALTIMISASAQTKNIEQVGSFGMPYVGVFAGGATSLTNFGSTDNSNRVVLPCIGLELGTYVTPVWGASVESEVLFNTNWSGVQTAVSDLYVLGNGKMNVSNFLAGYKGYPRRVEFVLVAGAGWNRSYNGRLVDGDDELLLTEDQMVYNTGAEVNVNLGKDRAWQVNVRPSVVWGHDADNQFGFDKNYATGRLNIGVTYKFGNRKIQNHNFVTNDYEVSRYDYDVLAARYDECSKREPEKVEVPVEVVVEKPVEVLGAPIYFGESMVMFPCGSAKLSADNKEVIRHFYEDAQDGAIIYIIGSADSATGSTQFNYDLANKRAQAVKAELIRLGADENEFEIDTTLDGGSTIKASRSAFMTIKNSSK